MTPKQRFEAAMKFCAPDDYVSFMELEFQIYKEYVGKSLITGFEYEKLSTTERERALYHNAEVMVETAEKAGHDAIVNINGYWEISPGEPALLWLRGEEARIAQIKALKKVGGDKYFIIGFAGATMCIPDGNHIYDFVIDLYENPEDVKQRNEEILLDALSLQNKLIAAGADGIINASDVAFNSGTFISPPQMDEFFFPYFNRWVESVKSLGAVSIWHTDGNIMAVMDRAVESGVNAIQCIDPIAGMDIIQLKKQFDKKLALIGNIDCSLLQFGPKDSIDAQVKKIVEGCKGSGGFVLSGCNAIFKGISGENYHAMVNARYKYGKENKK